VTCVYYTNNREEPLFQERMQKTLLETLGDVPLISVSHKPMNFGKNICIGEKVPSSHNLYRQLQVGAIEAKTKYVCTGEADNLYPKEYFEFLPANDRMIYKVGNIYILWALSNKVKQFYRKRESESAIVVGRDYLIETIDKQLKGKEQWGEKGDYEGIITPHLSNFGDCSIFHNAIPVITFKTDNNLHRKSPYDRSSGRTVVPYWGTCYSLIRKYLCE
jgi:hypothetical protein